MLKISQHLQSVTTCISTKPSQCKDAFPFGAAFVPLCTGLCVYECEKVKERTIKDMGEAGSPPTWPSCCRGDKQSKRDVLAEAEPFVLSLKKACLIG